jgi:hypothetical protein
LVPYSLEGLDVPNKQEFAINNVQMNMSKKEVEDKLGKEKRITSNVSKCPMIYLLPNFYLKFFKWL